MIGHLAGILLEKNPPQIVIDVNGVGYEVDVPMSTFYHLPETGQKTSLFIHMVVREDALLLFGFLTDAERKLFRLLLKVSGFGAKTALSLLSGLSAEELISAVTYQDHSRLIQIPGIGKKTAERLLLELKDKIQSFTLTDMRPENQPSSASSDILHALIALGYAEKEAIPAIKKLPDNLSVSDGIRQALQLLSAK